MSELIHPRPTATSILAIDLQTKLLRVIPSDDVAGMERAARILFALADELEWNAAYTEQYPDGLGRTDDRFAEPLEKVAATCHAKLEFSACKNAAFRESVMPTLAASVVVLGIESHVCVLQTVTDLQARGHQVFVPRDGVASRAPANRDNGLALMERSGAVITNTETIAFACLERAGTERFKRIARLIR